MVHARVVPALMAVLISHPSTAPFVQQAARALLEADLLDRFCTTVADRPASAQQRLLVALARLSGTGLHGQFSRRAVTEVPDAHVDVWPWRELLRLVVAKTDRGGRTADRVWEWAELGFDRHIARRLGATTTAVYGYEHCSSATFTAARDRGLGRIYDVPAPHPATVQAMLEREIARFPILDTPLHRHNRGREARRAARRHAEWNLADRVIAASRFTRDSFTRAGLDAAKIRVVPYGAPPPALRDEALRPRPTQAPVRLLWAGTFSVRKGAHYVVEAWRRHALGRHAQLRIFGTNGLPAELHQPWPDGIEFLGSVPRDALLREYDAADALLFPTLCDGFGMVATEAWSRGCPVITTPCAGAVDLLRPDINGLLIEPASADAIAAAVERCAAQRPTLAAMREPALATAAGWQWTDYRRALVEAIRDVPGVNHP